jgi:hypothetical protein
MEESGSRGHMILIEGSASGVANVSARVLDPLYQSVEHEITLTVMERLDLEPVRTAPRPP